AQKRPLLVATLAALALAALLAVLALAPPRPGPGTPAPPAKDAKGDGGAKNAGNREAVQPGGPQQPRETQLVASEQDLSDALAEHQPHTHLTVDKAIDLSEGDLAFRAHADHTLVIESKDPTKPTRIRSLYKGGAAALKDWAGLTLEGGAVTFRNLHFEVDAEKTPEALVAGLLIRKNSVVTFEKCTFSQKTPLKPLVAD